MQTFEGERRSRRLRFPRRWSARLALVAALLAALAVPAAWASHQYSDVPNSNPHHDDISAIAGAGITGGCAPGLYCPDQAVRRDQMGSFLRRGLGRVGASGTTAGINLTTTFQTIASDSITSGGTAGGTGFVMLLGSFFASNDANNLSAPYRMVFRFRENQTGFLSNESEFTLYPSTGGLPTASPAKQWVFSIPTATTRTYSLEARIAFPASPGQTVTAYSRLITLLYVPFGSTGSNTLSGMGDTAARSVDNG